MLYMMLRMQVIGTDVMGVLGIRTKLDRIIVQYSHAKRFICLYTTCASDKDVKKEREVRESNMGKIFSFSLIERVILSAGAMLIFSVSFQIDQMPEGKRE